MLQNSSTRVQVLPTSPQEGQPQKETQGANEVPAAVSSFEVRPSKLIMSSSKGVFERGMSTGSGFFHFWVVVLLKLLGKSSLYQSEDCKQYKTLTLPIQIR